MSASWLADKIEQWPTAKLLPYARNARTHSDNQVAQIAASIAEFGFTNPILAGSDGIIVAGHGRLAAAQKLGLEIVPVVVLDHLSPTQRRALVIADNRIAENAGWDDAMLRIELEALQLEGFDLDITGFDADALAELIAGEEPDNEGQTDEDAVPEVSETPISRPGDVWIMGQHRLLCGDSTVAESYDRLMQDDVADMVFTDPPYNVNYANSARDKMRGKDRAILNDNLGDGFYDFLLAALTPTVAAGAVAKKWLAQQYGAQFRACMTQLGELAIPFEGWEHVRNNPFFAPVADVAQYEDYMDALRKAGDSCGARIRVQATGVPVGLGEPLFDKLDADIAYAMMGLNAVKGVEIGAGFASVAQRGTVHGDSMSPEGFRSNNAGGVLGGISTGQDLEVSIAIKPTSSIISPRESIDIHGQSAEVITKGRHDPCVGIRAAPIAEALLALVVMDHALRHRAQCADVVANVAPIRASFL